MTSAETAVLTVVPAGVLVLYLTGVAGAVIGRWTGLLSTREALLMLVIALVLPVVGSVISLTVVVLAWHHRRPLSAPTA